MFSFFSREAISFDKILHLFAPHRSYTKIVLVEFIIDKNLCKMLLNPFGVA
uniref:Uncharacterized protein n=1 Tax=Anguilla anguilla TaxID=7936 RepID=A0A0E9WZM5_ANGAN